MPLGHIAPPQPVPATFPIQDWATADALRDQIAEAGFAVKDVKGGDPEITKI